MSAILQTKRGNITYSDDYIGAIAGMATTECYGVVGMSSKKMTDGFVELLGRENLRRGVRIFTDQSNTLRIDRGAIWNFHCRHIQQHHRDSAVSCGKSYGPERAGS